MDQQYQHSQFLPEHILRDMLLKLESRLEAQSSKLDVLVTMAGQIATLNALQDRLNDDFIKLTTRCMTQESDIKSSIQRTHERIDTLRNTLGLDVLKAQESTERNVERVGQDVQKVQDLSTKGIDKLMEITDRKINDVKKETFDVIEKIEKVEANISNKADKTEKELHKWLNIARGVLFVLAASSSGIQYLLNQGIESIKAATAEHSAVLKKMEGRSNELESQVASIIASMRKPN